MSFMMHVQVHSHSSQQPTSQYFPRCYMDVLQDVVHAHTVKIKTYVESQGLPSSPEVIVPVLNEARARASKVNISYQIISISFHFPCYAAEPIWLRLQPMSRMPWTLNRQSSVPCAFWGFIRCHHTTHNLNHVACSTQQYLTFFASLWIQIFVQFVNMCLFIFFALADIL